MSSTIDGPVMVRNVEPGPTVFTDPATKVHLEWMGAGDPNGMDLQQVPVEILKGNVAFIRAVNKGILAVEEAPEEIRAALETQRTSWIARQEQARRTTAEVLDDEQTKDIIGLPCIGPKGHLGELCGEHVPIPERAREERPPLCPKHRGLAGQFVLVEDESQPVRGGASPKRWSRVTTTPRERQAR